MSLYGDIPDPKNKPSTVSGWGTSSFIPPSLVSKPTIKPLQKPTTKPSPSKQDHQNTTSTTTTTTSPPTTSTVKREQVAAIRAKASNLRAQLLSKQAAITTTTIRSTSTSSLPTSPKREEEEEEGRKRGRREIYSPPPAKRMRVEDGQSIFSSDQALQNEYDPLKPNLYEEFTENRARDRFNQIQNHDQHHQQQQQQQPPSSPSFSPQRPPRNLSSDLSISGEEAYKRRMMMGGGGGRGGGGGGGFGGGEGGEGGGNFATKMMKKMGWKEGQGLGKTDQGMRNPLELKRTGMNSGRIVADASTAVLLLENMVGPGEVDQDLEGETIEECSKYGKVVSCKIIELPPPVLHTKAVRIFLHFIVPSSAMKAHNELNGRYFGGRRVTASFYNEAAFRRKEYLN